LLARAGYRKCNKIHMNVYCSKNNLLSKTDLSVLKCILAHNISICRDVSFNIGLGGPMPASIGSLSELSILILAGCSFTGSIPQELGNLKQLTFLALNSNKFTGKIPASLGLLTNLNWFDLADNQLTGSIPISTATTPGLDLLTKTQHL
jgi:Leucine-rich repeat (LRR) protein